ncbi:hypothetical protein COCON_G00091510 [Conger conger]|uniref:Ig-like domain-containing protein n=1 Tax=Conger conger TaxID=82655 RepID=A0A9Q1DLC0_CONCO|nr:hypothetical protein COCON_G00091510 [Conger conger]
MQLFTGLVLTVTFCISSGEVKLLNMTEGQQVSMECITSTSGSGNVYRFYWYRQSPGSALQYILHRGDYSGTANFAKQRFEATTEKSSGKTTLTISNLIPEDSAIYYCALLRHTVILLMPALIQKLPDSTTLMLKMSKPQQEMPLNVASMYLVAVQCTCNLFVLNVIHFVVQK